MVQRSPMQILFLFPQVMFMWQDMNIVGLYLLPNFGKMAMLQSWAAGYIILMQLP
jgi:hypothetical protein